MESVMVCHFILDSNINPILKNTQGQDNEAKLLRELSTKLKQILPLINTSRGKDLERFDWEGLKATSIGLNKIDFSIKPFKQLFEIIDSKVATFYDTDLIWLQSAKWCFKHNLIQQGITQLQEGVLSYLISYLRIITNDNFYDPLIEKPRNLLASAIKILNDEIEEKDWKKEALEFNNRTHQIIQLQIIKDFSTIYVNFSADRNDVNHAGYKENSRSASSLKGSLESNIKMIETLIIANAPQSL
jgi:hypothetical protein